MTPIWKTEMPQFATLFGLDEIHIVVLQHKDDVGGACSCIIFQIPEATEDGIVDGLRDAEAYRARVLFVCDTEPQAVAVADLALSTLLHHRRVPLERAEMGWFSPRDMN